MHRVDRVHGVEAVLARDRHAGLPLQRCEEGLGHLLENPHRAVALHVAVAPDRAEPRAGPADRTEQKVDVGDLADGGDGVAVLGEAHRPAGDQALLSFGEQQREFLDRVAADPGQLLDFRPRGRLQQTTIFLVAAAVLADEAFVRRTHRDQRLGHPAEQRQVAVDLHLQVGRSERRGFPEDPAQVLRMGEAEQARFLEGIHRDQPCPAAHRFLEGGEHPRMIGPGILADAEDDVCFEEIVQRDGALADPDGVLQGEAARLVAHVRAVRQVVGPEGAGEHLPHEGGLVAGAAGGVEKRLVRGIEGAEFFGDDREDFVPSDRLIVRRILAQQHRLGEAALEIVPGIALRHQVGNGMCGEELAADGPVHRLRGDRLRAVLAELGDRAMAIGVGPGTARAVEAAGLVQVEQRLGPADHTGLAEDVLQRRDHRGRAGGVLFGGGESGFAHPVNLTGLADAARFGSTAKTIASTPGGPAVLPGGEGTTGCGSRSASGLPGGIGSWQPGFLVDGSRGMGSKVGGMARASNTFAMQHRRGGRSTMWLLPRSTMRKDVAEAWKSPGKGSLLARIYRASAQIE